MSADPRLRDAVDAAAGAVQEAEALLAAARARLAEARKEFLDDYLGDTPVRPPAGFHMVPGAQDRESWLPPQVEPREP